MKDGNNFYLNDYFLLKQRFEIKIKWFKQKKVLK